MDYSLNDDQEALVSAVQSILKNRWQMPQAARLSYCHYDNELQQVLQEAGFLDAGRDLGSLEAALMVFEVARVPVVVEAAASALIAPRLLPDEKLPGPIAIVAGNAIGKAHRNLSIASTVLIDAGDHVLVLPLQPDDVEAVATVYAYPFGKFRRGPDYAAARRLDGDAAATLRQWWRVALAVEFAGAAHSAVSFTIDYVKQRQVFGRPVGSFQAVQHRLAQCHQIVQAVRYLALKAAWSADSQDADLAACYAQQHVQKLLFDLHQFNGAMGVTNENLLHFWTYRLRALQAEAGGVYGAALDIAARLWGPMRGATRSATGERESR